MFSKKAGTADHIWFDVSAYHILFGSGKVINAIAGT